MNPDTDTIRADQGAPTNEGSGRLVSALVALLVITALEVGVVNLPFERAARITALVGLAMTKALVLLTAFMRIGRESRILRLAVLVPLVLAPGFAVALMLDAVFRVTQR
jgi:cytochrome c oxidase subunit IV